MIRILAGAFTVAAGDLARLTQHLTAEGWQQHDPPRRGFVAELRRPGVSLLVSPVHFGDHVLDVIGPDADAGGRVLWQLATLEGVHVGDR